MKSHSSIRVVRVWCEIHTNPILGCFINPEGLSYRDFLIGVVPEIASLLTV
jgi:hypothetical protein